MKKVTYISAIILLSLVLILAIGGCKKETVEGVISAFISDNSECLDESVIIPTLSGDRVYAYRADNMFDLPTIQAGGYSGNDKMELGINIFEQLQSDFKEGDYYITGGSDIYGTGYIYYLPDANLFDQYITIDGEESYITVETLTFEEPDGIGVREVKSLVFYVEGPVRLVNYLTNDTICVRDFAFEKIED